MQWDGVLTEHNVVCERVCIFVRVCWGIPVQSEGSGRHLGASDLLPLVFVLSLIDSCRTWGLVELGYQTALPEKTAVVPARPCQHVWGLLFSKLKFTGRQSVARRAV